MFCEVNGCINRTSDKKKGISFHRFPDDDVLKQKWIDLLSRDDWVPNPLGKVCSTHFKTEEILKNPSAKALLIKTAETDPIIIDVEAEYLERNHAHLNTSTTNQVAEKAKGGIKSKFSVISELANDMNSIKSKINQHLKTRRVKNCRMRTKIEKLKKFLSEIKEECANNNPVLSSLFENALKEPQDADIDERSNDNLSTKLNEVDSSQQVEASESIDKITAESFRPYLVNELKKLRPEDLPLIRRDIQKVLESNKPIRDTSS
ncbi:THAP domain-containing protein 6-like isoform X2 [Planococcus citri]|uniref:THAP domain-containing protein 6-like isoform X2 n=1 Tax=Planococcus citri TaxID=170843 RepID=UPI0031FA44EC